MKTRPGIAAILVFAGVLAPAFAQDQAATERQLEQLRSAIIALQQEQARQVGRRDDGMAELREIELSLVENREALAELDQSIAVQSERLGVIAREQAAARGRIADEQDALGAQVRMSYMTGSQELIRVLLSQDSPADFGRMLVYYDYLNRHRSEQIAAVDAELEQLARLAAENESVTAGLESLRSEQAARTSQLEQAQRERQQLIATLDAAIESSGTRIEQMRAQETELNAIIASLNELLEGYPVNSSEPFVRQKGELKSPIEGRAIARFNQPRDPTGDMRWEAMLLAADAGTVVRAIYHGRVVVSQWSPHMGLLVILDHGDGYLSLYGHNGALLRAVGEMVRAGDPIAEVGNTGGQAEPALYFGILHDAEPENPEAWLK